MYVLVRGGSSQKLFEPRANRVIAYRVGSGRVILRFEVQANRVKNRVKKFFFSSQNRARKKNLESKSSQEKKFLMISLEQKKLSDCSVFHIYKNSAGMLCYFFGKKIQGCFYVQH